MKLERTRLLATAIVVGVLALFQAGPSSAAPLVCDVVTPGECQVTTLHDLGNGGTFKVDQGAFHILGPNGALKTAPGSVLTLKITGGLTIDVGGRITGECGGRRQQWGNDQHHRGRRGAPRRRRHVGRADLRGPGGQLVFRWQCGQFHHQVQLRVLRAPSLPRTAPRSPPMPGARPARS